MKNISILVVLYILIIHLYVDFQVLKRLQAYRRSTCLARINNNDNLQIPQPNKCIFLNVFVLYLSCHEGNHPFLPKLWEAACIEQAV